MMFNKDLFFSLCEKYDVELSKTVNKPMIKNGNSMHAITLEDVNHVFAPCQAYFDYSSAKLDADTISSAYYFQESLAVAC